MTPFAIEKKSLPKVISSQDAYKKFTNITFNVLVTEFLLILSLVTEAKPMQNWTVISLKTAFFAVLTIFWGSNSNFESLGLEWRNPVQ